MDVYKIGVEIALAGNIEAALGGLGKSFLGLQGNVDNIGKGIMKWGDAIKGVAAIAVGVGIFKGLAGLIEHGSELIHVQQQLAATGVSQAEATMAQAEAWRVSAKYGLEVSKVLGDIKEAQMVFGSTEHAIEFIDPLEKMRVVMNAVTEGSGNKVADSVYEMARAGELKGLQGPEQFMSYFDGMTKAITASGGKVTPQAFMMATQYGKLASKGWDEEFYTKYLPSMIQEMRPSTAGQSLMSLYGTLAQGKASKRAIMNMEDLGLIGDPSKIIHGSGGDPTGMNPGAVIGTPELIANPFLWAQKYLRPLLEKKLGHEIKAGDQEAIALLGGMFGNRNSAAAVSSLLLESNRIQKDAGLMGRASGLNGADTFLAKDPTTVMNNFKASWDNLLTSMGAPLVEPALKGMNMIADGMKAVTSVIAAHPDAARGLGEVAAGIAAIATAYGTYKLLGVAKNILGGGGLTGSAIALDRSAVMLSEAAIALGAKGGVGGIGGAAGGAAAAGGWAKWLGSGAASAAMTIGSYWIAMNQDDDEQLAKFAAARTRNNHFGFGEPVLPPRQGEKLFSLDGNRLTRRNMDPGQIGNPTPLNVTMNPQITATNTINIDGRALASYISQMVIKQVSNLIPHPTGAPMANSSQFAPSFDSGASH
jgi:hypothetical protein